MEVRSYKRRALKEIAEIEDYMSSTPKLRHDMNTVRVNKLIFGRDSVTSHHSDPIGSEEFAITPKKETSLKPKFLSFIFESGMFYDHLSSRHEKKGNALTTTKLDLISFDVPIPSEEIQLLIVKHQAAFEWAKCNLNDGYRYSGLRMATYDEIRQIIAFELYHPNQTQLMNIHPLEALEGIADIIDDPELLFEELLFERPEMIEQVKRFRSYINFQSNHELENQ